MILSKNYILLVIIMRAFNFLSIEREEKPRTKGVTMVLDKGLGIESAESIAKFSSDHIDFIKFGWGTSAVHDRNMIKEKVDMYKSYGIIPYTGGTLFELAYNQGKLEEFFKEAEEIGFPAIEISDGSTYIPHDEKVELIKLAKEKGFQVLSEVGKKNPDLDSEIEIKERIKEMNEELEAGSSYVIVEAREGGKNIGIFDKSGNAKEDEIDVILENVDGDRILWEAPNKDQQIFFVLKLGKDVNLGNIQAEDITSLETIRRGLRGDTFGKIQ